MAIARSRGALFAHAIPVNKHRMRAAIQALWLACVMLRPHAQCAAPETTVAAAGETSFIHCGILTPAHRTTDGCRRTTALCTPTAPTSRHIFRSGYKVPARRYSAACGCGWAWGRSSRIPWKVGAELAPIDAEQAFDLCGALWRHSVGADPLPDGLRRYVDFTRQTGLRVLGLANCCVEYAHVPIDAHRKINVKPGLTSRT